MTSIKCHLNDNSSLSHRYEQLLHSEKYYDCVFHVCGAHIRCHKLILATASPVFEAMFYGPLQEQHPLEIEILDISEQIFQILVTYLYTGSVDYTSLTLAQTIELHYSAEKYLLDELNADSLLAASQKLRFTNILPALELSVRMHLDKLRDMCMKFFRHCCLSASAQFSSFLQAQNYVHMSKECLRALLDTLPHDQQRQMLWFILLWCRHECEEFGLEETEIPLLLHELHLKDDLSSLQAPQTHQHLTTYKRERMYYKASRPFYVDADNCLWKFQLQNKQFIQLWGLTMHSRLKPQAVQLVGTGCHSPTTLPLLHMPDDYKEELGIEITCLNDTNAKVIWQHKVTQPAVKYNCHVNIAWDMGVLLSPDLTYEITLKWPESAFSAEYPCSVLSNDIEGIKIYEQNAHAGSLIKGLRYTHIIEGTT